jgi:hypothetical protein
MASQTAAAGRRRCECGGARDSLDFDAAVRSTLRSYCLLFLTVTHFVMGQ